MRGDHLRGRNTTPAIPSSNVNSGNTFLIICRAPLILALIRMPLFDWNNPRLSLRLMGDNPCFFRLLFPLFQQGCSWSKLLVWLVYDSLVWITEIPLRLALYMLFTFIYNAFFNINAFWFKMILIKTAGYA